MVIKTGLHILPIINCHLNCLGFWLSDKPYEIKFSSRQTDDSEIGLYLQSVYYYILICNCLSVYKLSWQYYCWQKTASCKIFDKIGLSDNDIYRRIWMIVLMCSL